MGGGKERKERGLEKRIEGENDEIRTNFCKLVENHELERVGIEQRVRE